MSSRFNRWPMVSAALLGLACATSCAASPESARPAPPTGPAANQQVDCNVDKCVALTFDDGPGEHTELLLDELEETGTPATFFLIGQNVQKYPGTVQRMAEAGHQLGNHTWSHADITALSPEQLQRELSRTSSAIEQAAGRKPDVFRPPLGRHDAAQDRLIPYPLILWDVSTNESRHRDPEKLVSIALDTVQPGSIVLMHDIHATTIQAMPELLSRLRAEGYTPVTVDRLFAGNLQNSATYSAAPRTASTR